MPKKVKRTATQKRDVKRSTAEIREGGSKVVDKESGKVIRSNDKSEASDNAQA